MSARDLAHTVGIPAEQVRRLMFLGSGQRFQKRLELNRTEDRKVTFGRWPASFSLGYFFGVAFLAHGTFRQTERAENCDGIEARLPSTAALA